jgi:aminoglycoside phosphotransferase (APT) family kinase protein
MPRRCGDDRESGHRLPSRLALSRRISVPVNQTDIQRLASRFSIEGSFIDGRPHGSGHINDTYVIRFDQGGTPIRYILQLVNQMVFKDIPALMENVDRVTRHLNASLEASNVGDRSRRALTLLPTCEGAIYHVDADGEYWRVYQFIEGATSYDVPSSNEQAYEVARAFGTLQTMLVDLPGPSLHETIPKFHDGPARFQAFLDALAEDPLNRAAAARQEVAFLLDNADAFDRLPALVESGALPLRATHNDCKINNVMIDDATGEGICVIDLDTLMPGLVLYDFGDMVRTSTCPVGEDSRDLDRVRLDLDRFAYLTRGYLSSAGEFLTPAEREQLVFSGKIITLTIGARFLTDHLLGDTYFKIHRPGHNLDRCRVQFELVRSISNQESAMAAVVEQVAGGP